MSNIQNMIIGSVRTAIGWVPRQWLPGGTPDPLIGRHGTIGTQASRLDGPEKVTGGAIFAAEGAMERLCYATLVHSIITRGRIMAIDVDAAERAAGVVLIVTHRNMPRLPGLALIGISDFTAVGNSNLPIMQDAEIHYNGQVVGVVVAETQQQADYAASLVRMTYEETPASTRFEDDKADAKINASLLVDKNHRTIGNPERELARSAHRVDAVYRTPWQNHNAIELHALTVAWSDNTLTVYGATQMISPSAAALAKAFGLKREDVRVLSPFVGGGFGAKGMWDHQIVAVAAARMLGRPSRLMLSRESVYRIVGGRSPTE